ncbi:hypothetical protein B0T17DRAFT_307847 [Bombardia bombarda]|uniref:Uncharacterized protein n=1 Tax=Bombardia bombarda TaxID=252184 RepID=A0AA39WUP8_9PEZI|nr:hypothetical protein B0T17DRAFT_307847 [Bombardia bombarda]
MLSSRYLSFTLALAALFGLSTSRPYLENDLAQAVASPGVSLRESPFGLLPNRRAIDDEEDNDERSSCRGVCNAQNGGILFGQASDSGTVTSRGLDKRVLDNLPDIEDMDKFMVRAFDADAEIPLSPIFVDGVSESTTSVFKKLEGNPFNVGLRRLCGCTMLAVVSPQALYMAHFFEDQTFNLEPPEGQDKFLTGQKEPAKKKAFEEKIQQVLEGTGASGQPDLKSHIDDFGPDVQVFFLTPKDEKDLPDGSFTYIPGIRYKQGVKKLNSLVKKIFKDSKVTVVPTVYTYEAVDKDNDKKKLLSTTARGHSLFQWGGPIDGSTQPGDVLARLIFEKGPLSLGGKDNGEGSEDAVDHGIVWTLVAPDPNAMDTAEKKRRSVYDIAKGLFGRAKVAAPKPKPKSVASPKPKSTVPPKANPTVSSRTTSSVLSKTTSASSSKATSSLLSTTTSATSSKGSSSVSSTTTSATSSKATSSVLSKTTSSNSTSTISPKTTSTVLSNTTSTAGNTTTSAPAASCDLNRSAAPSPGPPSIFSYDGFTLGPLTVTAPMPTRSASASSAAFTSLGSSSAAVKPSSSSSSSTAVSSKKTTAAAAPTRTSATAKSTLSTTLRRSTAKSKRAASSSPV